MTDLCKTADCIFRPGVTAVDFCPLADNLIEGKSACEHCLAASPPDDPPAVVVQTAPRAASYLEETIRSVTRAYGYVPDVAADDEKRPLGPLGNFWVALNTLAMRYPRALYYVLFEDDVLVAPHVDAAICDWLGVVRSFPAVLSLRHVPEIIEKWSHGNKWFRTKYSWDLPGSQGLVWNPSGLRAFLRQGSPLEYRRRGPRNGWGDEDCLTGIWARSYGGAWMSSEILLAHVGRVASDRVWFAERKGAKSHCYYNEEEAAFRALYG